MPQLKTMASKSPEIPQTHPILTQPAQSPLQWEAWAATLRSHPDTEFACRLHPWGNLIWLPNRLQPHWPYLLTATQESSQCHWTPEYLSIEVAKGRMLGPFPTRYIPDIKINLIGVIPKKSNPGKWRLLTDLHFPWPKRNWGDRPWNIITHIH